MDNLTLLFSDQIQPTGTELKLEMFDQKEVTGKDFFLGGTIGKVANPSMLCDGSLENNYSG